MIWKRSKEPAEAIASEPQVYDAPPPLIESQGTHHAVAHGFWQAIELHPAGVGTAVLADSMVSAIDVATLGISAPFLWLIAGLFVGVITFMSQKKWAGDQVESAFIKALIVAFLVSLPTPFPSFLTIPSGIVGMVQAIRRK